MLRIQIDRNASLGKSFLNSTNTTSPRPKRSLSFIMEQLRCFRFIDILLLTIGCKLFPMTTGTKFWDYIFRVLCVTSAIRELLTVPSRFDLFSLSFAIYCGVTTYTLYHLIVHSTQLRTLVNRRLCAVLDERAREDYSKLV